MRAFSKLFAGPRSSYVRVATRAAPLFNFRDAGGLEGATAMPMPMCCLSASIGVILVVLGGVRLPRCPGDLYKTVTLMQRGVTFVSRFGLQKGHSAAAPGSWLQRARTCDAAAGVFLYCHIVTPEVGRWAL